MTVLMILGGLMTALLVGWLTRPGLGRGPARAPEEAAAELYRSQIAEIDEELTAGRLAPDQAAAARREIARRLLAVPEGGPQPPPSEAPPKALLTGLMIVLPLSALGLYLLLGRPDLTDPLRAPLVMNPEPPAIAPALDPETQAAFMDMIEEDRAAMIGTMVEGLEARLNEEEPENVQGWLRLARARAVLGEQAASQAALARAEAAAGADDAALMQIADTWLALAGFDPANLGEPFLDLARKLAAARPEDLQVLYLRGLGHAATGEVEAARADWERVLAAMEPDTPAHDSLLADLAALGGEEAAAEGDAPRADRVQIERVNPL